MYQPLQLGYTLFWLTKLHPCIGVGGQKYLLFIKAPQIQCKEPWHDISILGWIVKSESPIELSTLKVYASYNGLALA